MSGGGGDSSMNSPNSEKCREIDETTYALHATYSKHAKTERSGSGDVVGTMAHHRIPQQTRAGEGVLC